MPAPIKVWSGWESVELERCSYSGNYTTGLTPVLGRQWTVVWSDGTKTSLEPEPLGGGPTSEKWIDPTLGRFVGESGWFLRRKRR